MALIIKENKMHTADEHGIGHFGEMVLLNSVIIIIFAIINFALIVYIFKWTGNSLTTICSLALSIQNNIYTYILFNNSPEKKATTNNIPLYPHFKI